MAGLINDDGTIIPGGALQPSVEHTDGSFSNQIQRYVTHEDAFLVYRSTGSRSLRNTATFLGVPYGTIMSWSKRYGWQQRSNDLDIEATEGVIQALAVAVVGQQVRNITRLAQIRDAEDARPKDQIESIKELNRQFERMADRMQLSGVLSLGVDSEQEEEEELETMASTPEGVAELLRRQRERSGKA